MSSYKSASGQPSSKVTSALFYVIIFGYGGKKQPSIPNAVLEGMNSGATFIKNAQKLTIEELIELYAYSEAIVETVREPLIVLDKDLRVRSVNKGFLKTFKVMEKDTVGKFVFDLGNGQWNIPALIELLYKIIPKKRKVEDYEVSHIFPHIGQKVMLLNARTIVLAQYRTQLILVAIEDITEEKFIEKRTEKFISMASHELKTPITSIMGFMQILEMKLKDGIDKHTSHIMSRVIFQLNVLNNLINDLFNVRKIKEGVFVINKNEENLDVLVKEAVNLFRYVNPKNKIIITGKIDKKIM